LRIGGLQKNSFIDFPGKASCVVFAAGCNFRCPYCHNPQLVNNPSIMYPEEEILEFLKIRQGWLDGVVISGGEPTLQADISSFCRKIKRLGFAVKLDTNGSNPVVLEQLISCGVVDYIAMDIKTDPWRYAPVLAEKCDPELILSSIRMIMNSPIPYEFKTTCIRPLVDESIMDIITGLISGARRYAIQRFQGENILNPEFFKKEGASVGEEEFLKFKAMAQNRVMECIVR
jgi:pyruvate formate lyase activating enzyme